MTLPSLPSLPFPIPPSGSPTPQDMSAPLKLLLVALLALLGSARPAQGIKCTICKFVAGKLEAGVPCKLIDAAGLVCEEGAPVCALLINHVCGKVVAAIENHEGVGPTQVCQHINWCPRDAYMLVDDGDVSFDGQAKLAAAADDNDGEEVDDFAGVSRADVVDWLDRRAAYMESEGGVQHATLKSGRDLRCWPDVYTGLYTCVEKISASKMADARAAAGLPPADNGGGDGGSGSGSTPVVLGVVAAAAAVSLVAGALVMKKRRADEQPSSSGRQSGDQELAEAASYSALDE